MDSTKVTEKIDGRILRLLGLEDIFDIDYETYLTLLKEELLKVTAFNKKIPTEEFDLLRSEVKRIKGKKGRFKIKKTGIRSDKVTNVGATNIGKGKPLVLSGKVAFDSNPKKEDTQERAQPFSDIKKPLESIFKTLTDWFKFNKKKSERERIEREDEKRGKRESKLEGFGKGIKSIVSGAKKLLSPFQELIGRILRFLTFVFLGRMFTKFMEWIGDEKNRKKLESLGRFLKAFWPTIAAAAFLFLTPFGKFVRGTIGFLVGSIPKLFRLISRIKKFGLKDLFTRGKGGLFGGGCGCGGFGGGRNGRGRPGRSRVTSSAQRPRRPGPGSARVTASMSSGGRVQRYETGGNVTGSSGIPITGAGRDNKLVPARPGDVILTPEDQKNISSKIGGDINTVIKGPGKKDTGSGDQLIAVRPGEKRLTPEDQQKLYDKTGFNAAEYVSDRKPKLVNSDSIKMPGQQQAMSMGGIVQGFANGGVVGSPEYKSDGTAKDPGIRARQENPNSKNKPTSGNASSGLLAKLGDGTKLANAPRGMCTTGVLETMAANGVPNPPGTGNDGNNPRGLMAQMMTKYGWGSMPYGKSININSPYGKTGAKMMNFDEWKSNVTGNKIPSGALVFSTRNPDWSSDGPSSGHDSAIAKEGGKKLWSGHWQSQVDGVGAVYGPATKSIVALTPGGEAVGYGGTDSSSGGAKDQSKTSGGDATDLMGKLKAALGLSGLFGTSGSSGGSAGGGGASASSGGISGTGLDKGVSIAKKLTTDLKIKPAAAAGIVGNLLHESGGLKPDNVEDGKGFDDGPINNIPPGTKRVGYGWAQWTNDRLENFRSFLKGRKADNKPATDDDNYAYLVKELTTTEPIKGHWKGWGGKNIPEDDPKKAATWFMMNWERPSAPHEDNRQDYAQKVFAKLSSSSSSPSSTNAGVSTSTGSSSTNVKWGAGGVQISPDQIAKGQEKSDAEKNKPTGGSGGSKILDVPYFNQRQNKTDKLGTSGDSQCYSTSAAMVLSAVLGKPVTPDEYNKTREKYGRSTSDGPHISAMKDLGVSITTANNGSYESFKSAINSGKPTILGLQHNANSGHMVAGIGYQGTDIIVNDPYGKLNPTPKGGWQSPNLSGENDTKGKGVAYSKSLMDGIWLDRGPKSGKISIPEKGGVGAGGAVAGSASTDGSGGGSSGTDLMGQLKQALGLGGLFGIGGSSGGGNGGGGGNTDISLSSSAYKPLMVETMNKGGISDKNERTMFMAQVGHESAEGKYLEEIASGQAYEGRSDLGNTQPGDGKRFKGRGYIQITGRSNYAKYGPKVGVPDATEHPEKLAQPQTAAKVALAYWMDRVNRDAAKKGLSGINVVTRNINGGLNGLEDRISKYKKYESDTSIQKMISGGGIDFSSSFSPLPSVSENLTTWAKKNRKMIEKSGTKKQREILAQVDMQESIRNSFSNKGLLDIGSTFGSKYSGSAADSRLLNFGGKQIAAQPGEQLFSYMIPKQAANKGAGDAISEFANRIVAQLDSNSAASKQLGKRTQKTVDIQPYSKYFSEGTSSSPEGSSNVITLPPIYQTPGSDRVVSRGGTKEAMFSPICPAGAEERRRILDTYGVLV